MALNVTGKIRVYRWDTRILTADPVVVTMMDGDYWEGEPAVSPNGEYVAYTRFYDSGNEICISPTDLTKRTPCTDPLTNRLYNSDPDWSPDGQWIAYTSKRGGNGEIHLVMISGAGDINLTDNPAQDLYPAWQPAPATS
jgi:Tol biopolymer transport system component